MRLTDLAHQKILEIRSPVFNIAVDATLGNGHDACFLTQHAAMLYGFDIQARALKLTQQRLEGLEAACRHHLIHDSHANIDHHIQDPIDVCMFNLGYLPSGDHAITTHSDSTVIALEKAYSLLASRGVLSVLSYPGHPEGKTETLAVQAWVQAHQTSLAYTHKNFEHPQSPILFILQKEA